MRTSEKIILNTKLLNGTVSGGSVFSDESENFINPFEPSKYDYVTVKLRIGTDEADEVWFVSDGFEKKMDLAKTRGFFDYYKVTLPPEKDNRRYSFRIISGEMEYYYNSYGLSMEMNRAGDFEINRNFKTPDWAKGAVGYQIFVDRFFNGDKTNDVADNEYDYLGRESKAIKDWNELPENSDISNFYGGDLAGVIEKLDYLKDLGIEMIYFNPIFVSPSNHKYDAQDYEYIDPHYGKIISDSDEHEKKYMVRTASLENLEASNELFANLVCEAHKRGIRVIIDGVFNHCGSFHKWLDKRKIYEKAGGFDHGAFGYIDSPYHDFFKWNGGQWPDNEEYDSWWGHKNHPKLFYENSEELFEYIMNIAEKWMKPPFNADGWRIDVGADLGFSREFNHKFWRTFRKRVKEANPEAIIIAEHYGDANEWLNGDEWDTVMNYDGFMEPVSWFFTGMEKHSDRYNREKFRNGMEFEFLMCVNSIKMGSHALAVSMNQLSNHDHSRFLTRTNHMEGRLATMGSSAANEGINIGIMKEAVAFQFIWPGLPTLYYGDEAGATGWTDPDNRRTYPWGRENKQLIEFHKEVIKLRKAYQVLRKGSFKFIYSDYGSVAVSRFSEEIQITAIFNNLDDDRTLNIPLWLSGAYTSGKALSLLESDMNSFSTQEKEYDIVDGCVKLTIPAYGCIILKSE